MGRRKTVMMAVALSLGAFLALAKEPRTAAACSCDCPDDERVTLDLVDVTVDDAPLAGRTAYENLTVVVAPEQNGALSLSAGKGGAHESNLELRRQ